MVKYQKVSKQYDHDCSLKLNIDKLDTDNLKATPVDLSKLSNVVKNDVVKRTVYNKLVKKVNSNQTNYTTDLVGKVDKEAKILEKIASHDNSRY